MKIICTHCQVGYQVNLPPIKEEGIEAKCARCHQKFMVKPQVRPGLQTSTEAQSQIATAKSPQKQGTASVDDLNHLLDNLLDEHLTPGTTKPAKIPLNIEKAPETETADTTGAEKGEFAENEMGNEYIKNDADEEPEVTQKKKFGLHALPVTKVSKWIILGSVVTLVLTGGGMYFASKTFTPGELSSKPDKNTKITETEREIAPKPNLPHLPDDFLNEDMTSEMTKSAGSSPGSEGTVPSPNATKLTLSTIMPVVFNATNVRELSFNLEIETTDQFSAEAVRKATPVYEKIMVATIESFLRNKSYNDILDINEKLQQRLQNNINQKIEGDGRIKKVTLKNFIIQ
jgi:flagellar basal body-associated protein FliL